MIKKKIQRLIMIIFIAPLLMIVNDYRHCYFTEKRFMKVTVTDGDTLILSGVKIRLQGIDAPELKQLCTDAYGKQWQCGHVAKQYLIALTENKKIFCTNEGIDRYQRRIGYCYANNININREMVKKGLAVAYDTYYLSFVLHGWIAQYKQVGLWHGQFTLPSTWRKQKKYS